MGAIKSISVFSSYFLAIFICFGLIIRSILSHFHRLRNATTSSSLTGTTPFRSSLLTFTFLALISLILTWYYMLRFFELSYINWSSKIATPDTPLTMENWLQDTKLFEQAYRIVVLNPERWWWSQQIFLACFGWGVWVGKQGAEERNVPDNGDTQRQGGRKGKERSITTLMAYMLFAQLVSLSVAVNLFFVDVLAHRSTSLSYQKSLSAKQSTPESKPSTKTTSSSPVDSPMTKALLTLFLTLSFIPTCVLPTLTHTPPTSPLNKLFFPALLLPHVALFLPTVFAHPKETNFIRKLYACAAAGSLACHSMATMAVVGRVRVWVLSQGVVTAREQGVGAGWVEVLWGTVKVLGGTLVGAHPAVSSVSFDVVMVGVSVAFWAGMRGGAEDGVWLGGGNEVVREGNKGRGKGFGQRVREILFAEVLMALGGAGLGALVLAGDA